MRRFLYQALCLTVITVAPCAMAQTSTYPDKPVTLVIPFTPGGGR